MEISIFLNVANLAAKRELLALYLNTFHSLPITRNGERLAFEDVVRLLDTETVDYDVSFGSALSEQLEVSIKVEKDKYSTAISWLRDLLYNSHFDESRLKIVAKKLEQSLPSEKREGLQVATSVLRGMTQDPKSSAAVTMGLLARLEDTPAIVKRLKEEPQAVVRDMEDLRSTCERSLARASIAKLIATSSTVAEGHAHSGLGRHLGTPGRKVGLEEAFPRCQGETRIQYGKR